MSEDIYHDAMTGLFNRRYLEEMVPAIVQDFIAQGQPFTLAMVDIDHFKTINDLHGHARGDTVLKAFGKFIRETTRSTDTAIRYGGDEFIFFLPHLRRQNAEPLLERLLKKCCERDFDGVKITLSIGLGSFPDDGGSYEKVFKAADASLYEAKRGGRNRIGNVQRKQISLPIKAFINRRDELNALFSALGGGGSQMRIVVINGNVGVGKTRLSREGLGMLNGREVLWADCLLFDETIAYYAVRELIKYRIQRQGLSILDNLPLAYRIEIGKLIPEIVEAAPGEIHNPVLDRYRLYEGVRRSLEAGGLPKVLLIDNFQWIDKESLDVIRYLVRSMKDLPHVLLLINRVEEIPESISEFIADASREAVLDEISVSPLTYSAVQECLRAIIGDEPDPKLVEYVFQTSGGNPYFLEELIRALAAGKFLTLHEDQWQFRLPQTELVPKSIERIALHKYDLLSREAQQVLQFASILGNFDLGLLRRLTDYGESELHALLTQINKYGLGKEVQGRSVFVDEISRQAIYRKYVVGAEAIELHRQVAEKIEAVFRGREMEVIDELATNYYKGRVKDKGSKYCLLAGQRAREKYANESALRYYLWAEELLPDDPAQQYELYLAREKVYDLLGMREAQRHDLVTLQELARRLEDPRRQAQVALRQASFHDALSDLALVIAAAQEAIRLAQAAQDPGAEAEGHLWWGTALQLQNQVRSAQSQLEQAIALARLAKAHTTEAFSLLYLGTIRLNNYNDHEGAADCYEQSLQLYRQAGDRLGEARALRRLGNLSLGHPFVPQNSLPKAIEYYEQSLHIAREAGNRRDECGLLDNLGIIFQKLGAYTNAQTYGNQALQIATQVNSSMGMCDILLNQGLCLHKTGENEAALDCIRRGLKIAQETNINEYISAGWYTLGCILTSLGRLAEATEAHQQALKIRRETGVLQLTLEPLAGLAQVCLTHGDLHPALAYVEEILAYQREHVSHGEEDYFRISLICYHVLCAHQDARAKDVLNRAYHMLQEQAAKIADPALYRSFLENVPEHRAIIAEFQSDRGPRQP